MKFYSEVDRQNYLHIMGIEIRDERAHLIHLKQNQPLGPNSHHVIELHERNLDRLLRNLELLLEQQLVR